MSARVCVFFLLLYIYIDFSCLSFFFLLYFECVYTIALNHFRVHVCVCAYLFDIYSFNITIKAIVVDEKRIYSSIFYSNKMHSLCHLKYTNIYVYPKISKQKYSWIWLDFVFFLSNSFHNEDIARHVKPNKHCHEVYFFHFIERRFKIVSWNSCTLKVPFFFSR